MVAVKVSRIVCVINKCTQTQETENQILLITWQQSMVITYL